MLTINFIFYKKNYLITYSINHDMIPKMKHPIIIDKAEAERIAGSREAADTFLGMYMKELPISWKAINDAFQANNLSLLQDELHKLLGATRYCGLPNMQTTVQHFEDDLKAGKHNMIEQHIKSLKTAINQLEKAYHEQL